MFIRRCLSSLVVAIAVIVYPCASAWADDSHEIFRKILEEVGLPLEEFVDEVYMRFLESAGQPLCESAPDDPKFKEILYAEYPELWPTIEAKLAENGLDPYEIAFKVICENAGGPPPTCP